MSNLKIYANTNPLPLVENMKDFWDDSVKNDKAVKIFLRISKALYADHVITQRQLRTMLLSGCAINYLCQYICLSVSLSSRLRRFLYIIHTARNCAQGMRMQATGSNPLSGSIIFPSVRPVIHGPFEISVFVLISSVWI